LFEATFDEVMVTFAVAVMSGLATDVAIIVTWPPGGMAGGAVNTLVAPLGVEAGSKFTVTAPHAVTGVHVQRTPLFEGS
jgi:hypothetical protein